MKTVATKFTELKEGDKVVIDNKIFTLQESPFIVDSEGKKKFCWPTRSYLKVVSE